MKVLFVGYHNPNYFTITEYFEKAFHEEGHEVISFDYRKYRFPGKLRKWFPFLQKMDVNNINSSFLELARSCSPELIFINWGGDISPETMHSLKTETKATVIFWLSDFPGPPDYFDMSAAKAKHAHIYSAQSTDNFEALSRRGLPDGRLLMVACDPELHHEVQLTGDEKEYYKSDMCFVGSYEPNREKTFLHIAKTFGSKYKFDIWGPGWDIMLPQDSPLRKHHRESFIVPEKWCKIYSETKIVLNVHQVLEREGIKICQAGPRVFEVMACRKLQIVNNFKDIINTFQDGKEIVAFSDKDDLIEKINYYLENDDERNRIAQNAYNAVIASHTYRHRIQELTKWLSE